MTAQFKLTVILLTIAGFLLGFVITREVIIGFSVMFTVAGVLIGFWTLAQYLETHP